MLFESVHYRETGWFIPVVHYTAISTTGRVNTRARTMRRVAAWAADRGMRTSKQDSLWKNVEEEEGLLTVSTYLRSAFC